MTGESEKRIPLETVRDVFETTDDPREPYTASEVAAELGCARRTAYEKMMALVDSGDLATKKVGARGRVWWRPYADAPRPTEATVRHVELHSGAIARPFFEVASDSLQVTVDAVVGQPDGTGLHYHTASGVDPASYRSVLEQMPAVVDVRLLSTVGDTCRMVAETDSATMGDVFESYGGHTTTVTLEGGVFRVLGELPMAVNVDDVLADVREVYPDVRVVDERVGVTLRQFRAAVDEQLTERQATVLQLALYGGYFASPRTSTGEDLADPLGITRQTFNHHLRAAQETVLRCLFAPEDVVAG